jgi:hypothetical protein
MSSEQPVDDRIPVPEQDAEKDNGGKEHKDPEQ